MKEIDIQIISLWEEGKTLDKIHSITHKSVTTVASKLVTYGQLESRKQINEINRLRGGSLFAKLEKDKYYTIYLIRDPRDHIPIYIGRSQNFDHRKKIHIKNYLSKFDGAEPIFEVLDKVEKFKDAKERERSELQSLPFLVISWRT